MATDIHYHEHVQETADTTWTIKHNLKKYPSVTIVDNSGNVVIGDINHVSDTQLTLSFTTAFAGKAYLN